MIEISKLVAILFSLCLTYFRVVEMQEILDQQAAYQVSYTLNTQKQK